MRTGRRMRFTLPSGGRGDDAEAASYSTGALGVGRGEGWRVQAEAGIESWVRALTAVAPPEDEALRRAAVPGRVRGIGVDLWARVRAARGGAGGVMRRGLREARALHSRERRLVGDLLRSLVRVEPLLALARPADGPLGQWLAWLVHLGLDPEAVSDEEGLAALGEVVDLAEAARSALADLEPAAALGALLGLQGAVAARVGADLLRGTGDPTAFLAGSAERAPVGLRAHGMPRDELVARLRAEGLDPEPGRWAADAVVLPAGSHLGGLGLPPDAYELQDEGSQLVAALLDVRPGERVLDACAGAGGKTLALGRALGGSGTLWATDVRGPALGELKRRAHAAGVRVRTALLREEGPSVELGSAFDAVLVDAPCTGSGVWRRHPELRWRLADLEATTALQDRVLRASAARVRPGGRLVYATCSVLRAEGEDRVDAFLAEHPGWTLVPARQALPTLDRALVDGPFLRTWPERHGVDGFFGACLERVG
ncbi:MAG: RsmB/NOP family class I SAM-dependent RNA methyltransferase [Alphaproteobacteria bacterium]|nr:RsmB/NOP family class I SAM-dependent RNA methyltransferase [Alphaproteobacteria bacterium]